MQSVNPAFQVPEEFCREMIERWKKDKGLREECFEMLERMWKELGMPAPPGNIQALIINLGHHDPERVKEAEEAFWKWWSEKDFDWEKRWKSEDITLRYSAQKHMEAYCLHRLMQHLYRKEHPYSPSEDLFKVDPTMKEVIKRAERNTEAPCSEERDPLLDAVQEGDRQRALEMLRGELPAEIPRKGSKIEIVREEETKEASEASKPNKEILILNEAEILKNDYFLRLLVLDSVTLANILFDIIMVDNMELLLRYLRVVELGREGFKARELAQKLEVSASTAYRIINVLKENNLLVKKDDGKYYSTLMLPPGMVTEYKLQSLLRRIIFYLHAEKMKTKEKYAKELKPSSLEEEPEDLAET